MSRIPFRAHTAAKQLEMAEKATNWSYSRRKPLKLKNVSFVDPECLTEDDVLHTEPGKDYEAHLPVELNDNSLPLPYIQSGPMEGSPIGQLEMPTSSISLYRNLLTLVYHHRPSTPLPNLTSYYHYNSKDYRSTPSYNFLISLAIRHASFGTARKLINAMKRDGLKADLETWKLKVRLMVRCGRWDEAWRTVLADVKNTEWMRDMGLSHAGIPLVIWIEFFMTKKYGSIRQWARKGLVKETLGRRETDETCVDTHRLGVLMMHSPTLTRDQYAAIPPRAAYFIVWAMLRMGHLDDARNMTRSYLTGLPAKLDDKQVRAALDTIHLHIVFGIKERDALAAHRSARQWVEEFLSMHGDLHPNARTLFLLLRPLKRSPYAGTHARRAVNAFCRQWGDELESVNVRRRIVEFAIKQDNARLVNRELTRGRRLFEKGRAEGEVEEWAYQRKPFKHAHRGSGVEAHKWKQLIKKLKSKNVIASSAECIA